MTNLRNEFYQFKALIVTEIEQLKNQNKIKSFEDRIKSFKDIKIGLKAFFSINGYSRALGTNSMFKKVFSVIFFIALFSSCMLVVDQNLKGYQENNVVTQFRVIDDENMIYPAVTFCLAKFYSYGLNNFSIVPQDFRSKFIACYFDEKLQDCSLSNFKHVQMFSSSFDKNFDCYTFNSGNNGIFKVKNIGITGGLNLILNTSTSDKLMFMVHENSVRPTFIELNNMVQQTKGKEVLFEMKKKVISKLPPPYSNCTQNINSEASYLVKEILQQNITYRKKYCLSLCFDKYIKKFATQQNISLGDAYYNTSFNYNGNCSHVCPEECDSVSFDLARNEINLEPGEPDFLSVVFYYSEQSYEQVSQSVKTSVSDLIANNGGVLGLFLELSFFSAYRFILFIYDFTFAFLQLI